MGTPRPIVVVGYNGVGLLDVTGPLEVFTAANIVGGDYELLVGSPDGEAVRTRTGTVLGADVSLAEVNRTVDTLVVAGGPDWKAAASDIAIVGNVQRIAGAARRVASVCTGAFVLAAAGLLDGKSATTHWRHMEELADRYPTVDVDRDALFVRDGNIITSAGVSAGIDLALSLVEQDMGRELARNVAKELVVFMQRPGGQSQFSVRMSAGTTRHEPLRRLLDVVTSNPRGDYSLAAMASTTGYSIRHLCRVFREEIGTSAGRYVEGVRVEAARSLLEEGGESLAVVARLVGFNSLETMRRAFLREIAVTPGDYRARFQTTGSAKRSINSTLSELRGAS